MPTETQPSPPHWCVLGRTPDGVFAAAHVSASGEPGAPVSIEEGTLAAFVAQHEADHSPRWVWWSTAQVYPELLAAGVRVARCHDLMLSHQILRNSEHVRGRQPLIAAAHWAEPAALADTHEVPASLPEPALFDLDRAPAARDHRDTLAEALAEFGRQRAAVDSSSAAGRLSLLLAAESAGALIAAELSAAGLPWDTAEHNRILIETLGPRPASAAEKPARMLAMAAQVREALGDPLASLDSPPKLLRALRAAGIAVESTSQWELYEHEHPAIAPLLAYKKLSRLLTANGWAWLDEWVRDGRYRPVYVPGGVVTGRWASNGGGALQLPRLLRRALRADPGWVLVSADVSQLEPRVLAAMSGDRAMAAAGRGSDLYAGLVAGGVVDTREEAKFAMLGAMYGATSGDSGRLVPQLRRGFPAAMRLVDDAAAAGERGGTVTTWLGRSSPPPDAEWNNVQAAASLPGASRRDEDAARRSARERGRFTRNFVVQGTAAEWALAWLAEIRGKLTDFAPVPAAREAPASGTVFARVPHLAFFLHDEVIVHSPAEHADAVALVVEEAAATAGRRLFGGAPVDFRLELSVGERAEKP
ncbi:bifunctional 3'-5' exonuclease/DNA polymerase [Leucobacter albus]|uniref:DNA-directed DNA polymerase n=1 Tax=Leucobacter albus TaxID=272210 RepID=A0ABW3TMA0_9MICO